MADGKLTPLPRAVFFSSLTFTVAAALLAALTNLLHQ